MVRISKYHVVIFILSFFGGVSSIEAQAYQPTNSAGTTFLWPAGIKMALSLTFDDARLSQPDLGIPLLNKYGVKATFYLSPENVVARLDAWKQAVRTGHEMGNHSYSHPCTGNFKWSRDNAIENYSIDQMANQLDSANQFIHSQLGTLPVSFAYPCGQTYVGRGLNTRSYVPVIAGRFQSGRGWLDEGPNDPLFCDLAQLTGMEMDNKSFADVLRLIDAAKKQGSWLVLAGHEMNTKGSQTTLLKTLEALCIYAKNPANGIWIGTVQEIASYISKKRK